MLNFLCFFVSSPEPSAHWCAYRIGRPLLSSTLFQIPSPQKPLGQSVKFHMELLWDGQMKVCSNGPGHMTKMATMPNLKKSSLEPKGWWPWNLVHRVLEYNQVCSNDDPGLTLTYFMTRSNLIHYAFVWGKGKTTDFSETVVVCDIKVGRCS